MLRTDEQLVQQSRTARVDAFGELVERYQARVWKVAFHATADPALSEDLTQEAFVAAWERLDELREPARFAAWVCGIARNLARHDRRHQRRHAPGSGVLRDPSETAEEFLTGLPCATPSPFDHAVARQRSTMVWQALEGIPPAYREPLILFYRDHQSIEQIAGRLDLNQATVKQRLARGRKRLRFAVEQLMGAGAGPGAAVIAAISSAVARAAAAGARDAAAGTLRGALSAGTTAAPVPSAARSGLANGHASSISGLSGAPTPGLANLVWLGLGGVVAATAAAVVVVALSAGGASQQQADGGDRSSEYQQSDTRASRDHDSAWAHSQTGIVDMGTVEITPVSATVASPLRPHTAGRAARRARSTERRNRPPTRLQGTVEFGPLSLERIPSSSPVATVVDIRLSGPDLSHAKSVRPALLINPPEFLARISDID
ncbi:MAG: sigma-70 family RNA polymerase sigma factor [Proteobacteria bacterium]|nr:sigma-70 family RNA polymerase sigma factor [Pseudomonadota bacterium]